MYVVNKFLLSNIFFEKAKHNSINIPHALPLKSIASFDFDLYKQVLIEQKKKLVRGR